MLIAIGIEYSLWLFHLFLVFSQQVSLV